MIFISLVSAVCGSYVFVWCSYTGSCSAQCGHAQAKQTYIEAAISKLQQSAHELVYMLDYHLNCCNGIVIENRREMGIEMAATATSTHASAC